LNKLFKDTLIYAFGSQASRIISILILPFITPHLTNKDYGINGIALAYIGSFAALKDLGMFSVIANTFYKHPFRFKFVWDRIFSFLCVWSIPLSLVVAIVLFIILPIDLNGKIVVILCTCLPIIFFDNLSLFCSRYLQLSQKPTPFVIISATSSCLTVLISYYTIVKLGLGYKGWFIAGFCSQFFSFLIYLFLTNKHHIVKFNFHYNYKWLKRYFKISLPAIPHAYSSYLMETSDRVILSLFMVNINLIGFYNIGYTFGQYFNILNVGLSLATSAFYLKLYNNSTKENELKVRNITFLIFFVLLLIASISGLWMKEVFEILIKNNELKKAFSITIVIIFCYVGNVFYMSSGNKLIALGRTNDLWKVSLTAGIINVILNIILIPCLNVWGSVIATFIGNSYLHFRIFYLKSFKTNSFGVKYYPMVIFSIISFVLTLTFLLKSINLLYKVFITISIIFSIFILYMKKRPEIMEHMKFDSINDGY
jgi:O-antigen/teichoic acid export membrane protein